MAAPFLYVAGDGVVFYKELAKIIKSKMINLPAFLAYGLAQLSWNLHIQRESTASGLDLVRYPMVLSTGKLTKATGSRIRSPHRLQQVAQYGPDAIPRRNHAQFSIRLSLANY